MNSIFSTWISPHLSKLNHRERFLIAFASVFVLLYFFYLFIESPLQTNLQEARIQAQEKQAALSWLRRMHSRLEALKPAEHRPVAELLTLIQEQLKTHPIFLHFPYHMTQRSNNQIELTFDKVPFNAFLNWFWGLNQQYQFDITHFQAKPTNTPGMTAVSCSITVL